MAAIASVSNVSVGARSVSFTAVSTGGDTLDLSTVVAAAYLAAGGKSSSALYQFLTTSHTDAAGTLAALAAAGAIVDVISDVSQGAAHVSADNELEYSLAGVFLTRIALASSIAA